MTNKDKPTFQVLLKTFERLVHDNKDEDALKLLHKILQALENGEVFFGANAIKNTPTGVQEATRMASAITQLYTKPGIGLNFAIYNALAQAKRAYSHIFEVSGFKGTQHFLGLMSSKDSESGKLTFQRKNIPMLFLALNTNALTDTLAEALLSMEKRLVVPLLMGFMSEQIVVNESSEKARTILTQATDKLIGTTVSESAATNFGPTYMGCSYADNPGKHNIKKLLNSFSKSYMASKGVTDAKLPKTREIKEKPTVLIIAELFGENHAMFRCYGPAVRALKDKFKLVLMTQNGEADPAVADVFDIVSTQKFDASKPSPFFVKAKSYKPDIVYYPSVGMRTVSIHGSVIRLAPIQIMTFGHPATTYSDVMDYVVAVKEQIGDSNTLNEKVLHWPAEPRYQIRYDAKDIPAKIRTNPDAIRLAVPAWTRKISPRFIKACQDIKKQSSKPIEFWFFPNARGAVLQSFATKMSDLLGAKTLPAVDYAQYIAWLNECDVFLSSFPFGATNGILDAVLQGLPVVNLRGPEIHSYNDSEMVTNFDQPSWLSTDTTEEYIKAVLRLIENDSERVTISNNILADDISETMLVDANQSTNYFGKIFESVYLNHEHIQNSDQHVWPYETLQAMLKDASA